MLIKGDAECNDDGLLHGRGSLLYFHRYLAFRCITESAVSTLAWMNRWLRWFTAPIEKSRLRYKARFANACHGSPERSANVAVVQSWEAYGSEPNIPINSARRQTIMSAPGPAAL